MRHAAELVHRRAPLVNRQIERGRVDLLDSRRRRSARRLELRLTELGSVVGRDRALNRRRARREKSENGRDEAHAGRDISAPLSLGEVRRMPNSVDRMGKHSVASNRVLLRCEVPMSTKAKAVPVKRRLPERVFQLTDVHPLTDFKRHTTLFRARLRSTGRPEVLTVDGRADLVVQDAASYQKLLDELDRLQAIDGIRRGLQDAAGGRGVSLEAADAAIRARLGLAPRGK